MDELLRIIQCPEEWAPRGAHTMFGARGTFFGCVAGQGSIQRQRFFIVQQRYQRFSVIETLAELTDGIFEEAVADKGVIESS